LSEQTPQPASRRDFLKTSAAVAGLAGGLAVPAVHAAGGDVLKVGLVGCGGRGTGAAMQALRADKNTRLVAMGDAFADRIEEALKVLQKDAPDVAGRIAVEADHRFSGFDAYKQVIANVDVVLLATPPGFRPIHLQAAIDAGKHVFCEKPMAVDGPGVRKVLAAAEQARQKNLSLVSGFCWRRHPIMRDTMKRLHDDAIGHIVAMQCSYNTGPLWLRRRQPGMSDMEYQMRNWYYFTWLSGDHNVEQHIHSLDKIAWALKDVYPVRAVGLGGRQVRTGPEYGHIFDHHAVVYEYANGSRLFSYCRQQAGCANDVSDHFWGTQGTCDVIASFPPRVKISGPNAWVSHADRNAQLDMYQIEHDELFASIRAGKPINDGEWMAKSTLMGIMGRMATYTGQVIRWEDALHSKEDLSPPAYDMRASLPTPKVALPGVTKFV
jgi:predicted dehydrogenase